jgi:thiol:disulfide interchange protein DsbC
MRITSSVLLALSFFLLSALAHAQPEEDRVLSTLRKTYPKTTFTRVSRTPIAGVYEVWMGENVAFVGKDARYFLFGRLFDARTGYDLTAPKLANAERREVKMQAISFDSLPLADAIKTVRGKGARVLALFSDPSCPYCKLLEPELAKLDDVTIYTFLLPFQGHAKPLAIWCAADRGRAWRNYMLENDASLLQADASCAHPLERNLALAERLNVRGTPTLVFGDGTRIAGYTAVAEIEARLVPAGSPASARASLSAEGNQR